MSQLQLQNERSPQATKHSLNDGMYHKLLKFEYAYRLVYQLQLIHYDKLNMFLVDCCASKQPAPKPLSYDKYHMNLWLLYELKACLLQLFRCDKQHMAG